MLTEEEIQELQTRVTKLERALETLWPGWNQGAHEPGCSCAACDY